ncbi:MAG: hypothetical protein M5U26_08055 [Planctomycetota bacterium]|nr:hypothetical protein [Planctomycetota bacterium]
MRAPWIVLILLSLGLVCGLSRAGESLIELDELPEDRKNDTEYVEYLKKKQAGRERQAEFEAQLRSRLQDDVRKMETYRKETLEPQATSTVDVDGNTVNVKEPKSSEEALSLQKPLRDQYEISPEDYNLYEHERWSLNDSDFQFDRPQYIVADTQAGRPQRWLVLSYSITNSTTKARRISPTFVAVTNNGVFTPAVDGYVPERMVADSLYRPLAGSEKARDKGELLHHIIPLESVPRLNSQKFTFEEGYKDVPNLPETQSTFLPGQTRWGVAVWPAPTEEWTELKIAIQGLSNAHRYDRKQRHALVLAFTRNDDEYHVDRSTIKYVSKKWEYLWMWDQDVSVPLPENPSTPQIKDKKLATPGGGERFVWAFPYEMANTSPETQSVKVRETAFVLRGPDNKGLEVDVGGQKARVEVKVVDDGRSTIYKAQFTREAGVSDPAREIQRFAPSTENQKHKFPGGMTHLLKTGEKFAGWSIFDAQDVDWSDVRLQVESQLSLQVDKAKLSDETWRNAVKKIANEQNKLAERNPGILYDPRRRLTDDVVALKDGRSFTGTIVVDTEQGLQIDTLNEGLLHFEKAQVEKVTPGEFSAVKKQILEAIPAAVEAAKQKKQVMCYFNAEAGLSTGSYRVARWYRIPGKIEEEWLNAWESLDAGQ